MRPRIDGGRFSIKRVVGESLTVTADVFADGHEAIGVVLKHRCGGDAHWTEIPMAFEGNDSWRASFHIARPERHLYRVEAWVDHFETWRRGVEKKAAVGKAEPIDFRVGAELARKAAGRAGGADARELREHAEALEEAARGRVSEAVIRALEPRLRSLARRHADRAGAASSDPDLAVVVDRNRARFGTWYELFPRSCTKDPNRHGRLDDVIGRLAYVSEMGFDVLYLPPIHPIGRVHRKGRNNSPASAPGDVGSPWAIGSGEGGHDAIHPELGTLDDFGRLVEAAHQRGIEIAMDLALQCAPDHPWVTEHPEWFRRRPDGSVQYAENPPKRYEDIYPLDFEGEGWRELWDEVLRVVLHWVGAGVRIFRVDNPHTKPFRLWEWLIAEVKRDHPDVLFLAEAFTRPKVMQQLAKLGFTQSYTYFTWRNSKAELTEYLLELTRSDLKEYFRPNFWPNTPDILPEPLQVGGAPAFKARLVLAGTLAASYGLYGPAFELAESGPREPGSEEYLDSEKYEVRAWDLDRADSLRPFIARLNRIRRENPALQWNDTLRFHQVDNEQLIAYSKTAPDGKSGVLVVVNLDPHHRHTGWLEVDLETLGVDPDQGFQVHDLLTDARFFWSGPRNFVDLDPQACPAHVFRVRRRTRSERDFDYFL